MFVRCTGYCRGSERRNIECCKVDELIGEVRVAGGGRVEHPVSDVFAKAPLAYRTEDDAHGFG